MCLKCLEQFLVHSKHVCVIYYYCYFIVIFLHYCVLNFFLAPCLAHRRLKYLLNGL